MTRRGTKKARQQEGGVSGADFRESLSTRYGLDRAFTLLVTVAALVGVAVLAVLVIDVTKDGSSMLSLQFLTSFPSQIFPESTPSGGKTHPSSSTTNPNSIASATGAPRIGPSKTADGETR